MIDVIIVIIIRLQNHKCNEVEYAFQIFKVSCLVRVASWLWPYLSAGIAYAIATAANRIPTATHHVTLYTYWRCWIFVENSAQRYSSQQINSMDTIQSLCLLCNKYVGPPIIVGPKCTLAASHAAPWLVTVSMPWGQTDEQMDGGQTVTLRRQSAVRQFRGWFVTVG